MVDQVLLHQQDNILDTGRKVKGSKPSGKECRSNGLRSERIEKA